MHSVDINMTVLLENLNFWYVWPVGAALWLMLGWAEFGVVESYALKFPSSIHVTLSYWVYRIATKMPLALALGMMMFGMFWGGLFVHFFWHWCPPGSISAG